MKNKLLYENVFLALKDDILKEKFSFQSMLPSERVLCEKFGVERSTIRKALDLLVKDNLVQKKAGVGTRVIYKNELPLKQENSSENLIGFFLTEETNISKKITQPYYNDLLYNLEIEGQNNNCKILYMSISSNTNIKNIINNKNFISIAFGSKTDEKILKNVEEMGIPVIMINESHPNFTSISYDNIDGAYKALEHLFNLGHKNIALISGPKDFYTSKEKMIGCYKAMHEENIFIPDENIYYGDWEFKSGYDGAMKLFSNSKTNPTALFAFNDMMAIGAMKALSEMGLSIPNDISIIGFDNMDQLKFTEPNLTTIDSNINLMAKIIIKYSLNIKNLTTEEQRVKILTPIKLLERKTTEYLKQI